MLEKNQLDDGILLSNCGFYPSFKNVSNEEPKTVTKNSRNQFNWTTGNNARNFELIVDQLEKFSSSPSCFCSFPRSLFVIFTLMCVYLSQISRSHRRRVVFFPGGAQAQK